MYVGRVKDSVDVHCARFLSLPTHSCPPRYVLLSGCGIAPVGVSSGAGRGTGGVSCCLGENCPQSDIRENQASRNGSVM